MLFDWLVTGQVLEVNPAHAVRGPKYVVKKGKTPVLNVDEARTLLDSIPVVVKTTDPDGQVRESADLAGLRDRALIGLMVYTFARVSAVIRMKVSDYFVQGRRGWVRLHEKGGKEHEVPCHHTLEELLDAGNPDQPLFQTAAGHAGILSGKALWQQDAYRIIQRRAAAAGIETQIGNHTFRATGITAYLKNGGQLETAAAMANHSSTRTTQLYDRRADQVSLDEIERVRI
jgi:site-specific recombinase XerD